MFISKYIYNLQVTLRTFYFQIRDSVELKRTPKLQQTIYKPKELTEGTLLLAFPNPEKPFYYLCDASNCGIDAALP